MEMKIEPISVYHFDKSGVFQNSNFLLIVPDFIDKFLHCSNVKIKIKLENPKLHMNNVFTTKYFLKSSFPI